MRHLFASILLCLLAALPMTAVAEEPAESIQSVIADQITAFGSNDVVRAFTHASPSIQQIFGNPQKFGRMVEAAYPMVWRPRHWEMRQLVNTEMGPVQVVLFEDSAGALHEAGYLMTQVDGVWRIDGVKLRALPQVGA